ncbi:unnamed protein product, partial [Closterium sp. NIES-54]
PHPDHGLVCVNHALSFSIPSSTRPPPPTSTSPSGASCAARWTAAASPCPCPLPLSFPLPLPPSRLPQPYAPATLSARRARHAWWTCRLPSPPPLPLFRPLPSPSAPLSPPPAVCPGDIVCPSGASCVVGSVGFPFCKCPVGQAIINGACGPAASWSTVGTNVVLYTRASFANDPGVAPAVLRASPPNTSACVNIPFAFQGGHVGSLRIMWNVDDGAPDHLVCGKVVFWAYGDCVGSSQVVEIPGKWTAAKPDNFKYATTSYNVVDCIDSDSACVVDCIDRDSACVVDCIDRDSRVCC